MEALLEIERNGGGCIKSPLTIMGQFIPLPTSFTFNSLHPCLIRRSYNNMSPVMFCSSIAMVLLLLQTAVLHVNGKYIYHDQEDGLLDERYLEALEGLKEAHAGAQIHSSVSEKSKTIPVPVFQKVGVPVPHPVPVAVPHYVKVYIPQPYPLQVNVEQPIKIPIYKVIPKVIEKPVPYTVEKPYPIEVEKPFPVEVLKKIEVPVPKPFPVPVTVYKHIMQNEKTHRNWHF